MDISGLEKESLRVFSFFYDFLDFVSPFLVFEAFNARNKIEIPEAESSNNRTAGAELGTVTFENMHATFKM